MKINNSSDVENVFPASHELDDCLPRKVFTSEDIEEDVFQYVSESEIDIVEMIHGDVPSLKERAPTGKKVKSNLRKHHPTT